MSTERPACFDFAMDFLGGPEDAIVIAYVESLEAELSRAKAAIRELVAARAAFSAVGSERPSWDEAKQRLDAAWATARAIAEAPEC